MATGRSSTFIDLIKGFIPQILRALCIDLTLDQGNTGRASNGAIKHATVMDFLVKSIQHYYFLSSPLR